MDVFNLIFTCEAHAKQPLAMSFTIPESILILQKPRRPIKSMEFIKMPWSSMQKHRCSRFEQPAQSIGQKNQLNTCGTYILYLLMSGSVKKDYNKHIGTSRTTTDNYPNEHL